MNYEQFEESLKSNTPPQLSPLLLAMWYEGRNDWHAGHNIAQDLETTDGAWIHAYLHRREGDTSNAQYWYRRAGRSIPELSLQEEWSAIVRELLVR